MNQLKNDHKYTVWAECWEEAAYISDCMDELMDKYGAGTCNFTVKKLPTGKPYPFDTCFLTAEATEEIRHQFIVTR